MNMNENFDNIYISSQESDLEVEYNIGYSNLSDKHADVNCTKPSSVTTIDDDDSNDSEDVTFIRNISKPLINNKKGKGQLQQRIAFQRRKKWLKLASFISIFTFLIGILTVAVFLIIPPNVLKDIQQNPFITKLRHLFKWDNDPVYVKCDNVQIETLWVKQFPLMISEGAIRLLDINNDGVMDLVVPFGTNIRNIKSMKIACRIYFPGHTRCFGGLLGLNGKTGDILWQYNAKGEMYAATCQEDLNEDGWIDCLGAGRQGTFAAVSGRDGSAIWEFDASSDEANRENSDNDGYITGSIMNLYTAQFINDQDGDGVRDIIQIHGGDPVAKPNQLNRLVANILVFSGRTGKIIDSQPVPDKHESYYSPQILNLGDGNYKLLVGTGGETYPGNLYSVKLHLNSLISNVIGSNNPISSLIGPEYRVAYKGARKGVMTPPVLVDLNMDGRRDIVLCPFGDECLAIDGVDYKLLWKFDKINNSETYASPAAGYYNNDNVPDIFIQLFVGLGYPVYFYGETLILDGRTGNVLKYLPRSNNVVSSSPLVISVDGLGNDMFLYWLQTCDGHETEIDRTPLENVPQFMLSRADICHIRFNTSTTSVYRLHSRQSTNTDSTIYTSTSVPASSSSSSSSFNIIHKKIIQFLQLHPRYTELYKRYNELINDANTSDEHDKNDEHISMDDVDLNDSDIHENINFGSNDDGEKSEKSFVNNNDNYANVAGFDDGDDEVILKRIKRHNGPHDGDGKQRLISTGTLAPSLDDSNVNISAINYTSSIDVVFSTYWSTPYEVSLQTKRERICNNEWAKKEALFRFQNGKNKAQSSSKNKFKGYDHDHYLEYGERYCAQKYGRKHNNNNRRAKPSIFNIHSGQLSVYRKRITCSCSATSINNFSSKQKCAKIKPISQQKWPAYLGLAGNSYWGQSDWIMGKLTNNM